MPSSCADGLVPPTAAAVAQQQDGYNYYSAVGDNGAAAAAQGAGLAVGARPAAAGAVAMREGDWTCPVCSALVFASKTECFKCRTPKPAGMPPRTTCPLQCRVSACRYAELYASVLALPYAPLSHTSLPRHATTPLCHATRPLCHAPHVWAPMAPSGRALACFGRSRPSPSQSPLPLA